MKSEILNNEFRPQAITPSMYQEIYQSRSDAFAVEHNPFAPCDFAEFSKIMDNFSVNLAEVYSAKGLKWVITQDEKILAVLGISQINKMMKTAEIGHQVNPKLRGMGIGTKAVFALINHVFANSDLRKLIATISDNNIPSCKIVEKIGFKQEGLLRKHFLINGQERDERLYGILRGELTRSWP